MPILDEIAVPTETSTNAEIIAYLQSKGADVNPNSKKADLLSQVSKLTKTDMPSKVEEVPQKPLQTISDMDKLMSMVSQVASQVETLNKRITSIETSGKGDFKLSVKESDVLSAADTKKNVDQRIVSIVEDVLGVDFGVEIVPNPNGPGFQFSVLVPERLSEVKRSTRPIIDETTGLYKLDPKTNQVVEEEYWPGDKRSRAIGSTDSFDVIRDQCNRVRAYIISFYEKNKRPVPEFRLK